MIKTHKNILFSCFLIIILIFNSNCNIIYKKNDEELLKLYSNKTSICHGKTFNVTIKRKDLFTEDTLFRSGVVKYKYCNNKFEFIEIIEPYYKSGLYFSNDSLWSIDFKDKTILYQGDWTFYKANGLSSFLPYENLFYSNEIFKNSPSWEYLNSEGVNKLVNFKVNSLPSGLTELKHEIFIDTLNLNITKIVDDGTFGEIGNLYIETNFLNIEPFFKENAIKPDYFRTFTIDLGDSTSTKNKYRHDAKLKTDDQVIACDNINLLTLTNDSFKLPSDGYIFFDLWYIGCYPCMKAAPEVEKAYHKYKDKVHFFSINDLDNDIEKIKRFKDKMNLTISVLRTENQKQITRPTESNAYPYFVLFEASTGKVIWQQEGFPPDLEKRISEAIESVLVK